MSCHYFFFFQAEDGIRDYKVTGVQTCALPISLLRRGRHPRSPEQGPVRFRHRPKRRPARVRRARRRSEERRVGEECRSRGAPDHLKKKKKRCKQVHVAKSRV